MTEYNELTPELVLELKAIVGKDNCYFADDINEDYAHDEMPIYGSHMPDAVVLPADTEEVSAIMKLCNENRIPITVRGAGTGLVGGSTPVLGGVVLCTMRMDKIIAGHGVMILQCHRLHPADPGLIQQPAAGEHPVPGGQGGDALFGGQGKHLIGGDLAPDKHDAAHIQHFRRADDLLVEQAGKQQRLTLSVGQHIAHHIAGKGAVKFIVVLHGAAQQAGIQQGDDLGHFHGISILSAKSGGGFPPSFLL